MSTTRDYLTTDQTYPSASQSVPGALGGGRAGLVNPTCLSGRASLTISF